MIEFQNLQNRFLIHQALLAAASANAASLNTNSFSGHQHQHDSLEINTSSSSVNTSSSSLSSSPVQTWPNNTSADNPKCHKRKLSETDDSNNLFTNKRNDGCQKSSGSSFLISDILGLNSANSKQELPVSDELRLYQQYQANLQQSYYSVLASSQLFRMITNTAKLNEFTGTNAHSCQKPEMSPIPRTEPEIPRKKCAMGILSSLEQMTKRQFTDDDEFDISSCLNESSKRSIQSTNSAKPSRDLDEPKKTPVPQANKAETGDDVKVPDDKSKLFPAWVYCTRYSDRPSAGPRQRKKSKASININNTQIGISKPEIHKKPAELTKNAPYNTSSSSNSSFSYSPQFSQKKQLTKAIEYEPYTENDSKIFNEKLDTEFDNDEEVCYDSDDSNMSNSKRPRTAFTSSQLNRLKNEFEKCKYLTGEKRQYLANELKLNESQIKIWFQNKRAKLKKSSGVKNTLAVQLMAQGLYNHGSNKDDEN